MVIVLVDAEHVGCDVALAVGVTGKALTVTLVSAIMGLATRGDFIFTWYIPLTVAAIV
jgi:hypothetical protein